MYNLTNLGNQSSLLENMQIINNSFMFGWFGNGLIITIGLILLIGFYRANNNIKISFLYSSFLVFVMGILMRSLDFITDNVVIMLVFISASAIFLNVISAD